MTARLGIREELTLTVRVTDDDERERLTAWRKAGVDDEIASTCLLTRRIETLMDTHRGRHRHVLVACMPKSASTFLNAALVAATEFRPYLLNTIGGDTERNIDARSIPMFLARDTVSQEHMRATAENVRLLDRLGVRPVVLVRDVFDLLVSMRDHAEREGLGGPVAHTPATFLRWTREEQLWFLVRMATPWLLSMYVSWFDATSTLPTLMVNYDEVAASPVATVRRVLDHARVPCDPERIERAIAGVRREATRFNRGVPGRGVNELSAEQRGAVRAIAAVYRGVYDLSPIGLAGGACDFSRSGLA